LDILWESYSGCGSGLEKERPCAVTSVGTGRGGGGPRRWAGGGRQEEEMEVGLLYRLPLGTRTMPSLARKETVLCGGRGGRRLGRLTEQ